MPGLDEFQIVLRRRRHIRRQFVNHVLNRALNLREPEINTDVLLREVLDAVIALRNSPYREILYKGLAESLSVLDNSSKLPEIICYGLGNFSENRSSKYQLAALLTIKSRYKSHVQLYDPVFLTKEIEVLKILGLSLIDKNEEGKHRVDNNNLTLFYMPHCFQGIIANCIYANWGKNLNNCILMTNSFDEINDDIMIDIELRNSIELIKKIHPLTTEFKLMANFDIAREAFNSTSIHIFTMDKIERIGNEFWQNIGDAPFHQDNFERNRD